MPFNQMVILYMPNNHILAWNIDKTICELKPTHSKKKLISN